ncbi:Zinc finger protein 257-like 1 [Homarus americanus]|uniref:Zinc finger protein 257-like 1 n=1 Tax=Homarus americanus TaxID=6706 RepID=A0A8J5KFX6_HOMAM|nr:Zinc finger protein 257-like 1 [Homarus americanus]
MADFVDQMAKRDEEMCLCEYCGHFFHLNDALQMHTCKTEHADVIDIKYEEVDESFDSNCETTQHVALLAEKDIKCEAFDVSYNSNFDETQHVTVDEKDNKCEAFDVSYNSNSDETQHVSVDEKDNKCEAFDVSYNSNSDETQHVSVDEKDNKCEAFDVSYNSNSDETQHVSVDEKDNKCEAFDVSYNSNSDETQHVSVDEKDNKCEAFDVSYNSNSDETQHVSVDEKDIKCEAFDVSYNSNSDERQHVTVDEENVYCENIDISLNSNSDETHVTVGEENVNCEDIDVSLNSNSDETHVTVDEENVNCEESFNGKNQLMDHLVHSVKIIKCYKCGKIFDSQTNLKQHLLVHTGEKNFKCEECNKRFSTKKYLKVHMEVHTGEKYQLSIRAQIIGLRDGGLSIRAIAHRLGTSTTTVAKWIKRWKKSGNLSNLEGRHRPRLTTPQQDERIQREAEENPFTNAEAIRKELQLEVSTATVRRRLYEAGIQHMVPVKKERLTDKQRSARLAFASQYERRNISEEARSGYVTCNVWGWISIHGMGDVTRLEGRFTAAKYIDILQDFFLPSLQERNFPFPPGPIIFVQDSCPIHMTRVVRQWFTGQENLQLLDWPSKGTDCNPTENIWRSMVNTWKPEREKTSDHLLAHIKTRWELCRAKPQLLRNHISCMSDRLQAVIDKEGGWTHY